MNRIFLCFGLILFFAHVAEADPPERDSFIKEKTIVVGSPPRFSISVKPMTERELLVQGVDFPEWYGKLEIRSAASATRELLYSEKGISGLELSSSAIRTDVLPASSCLWIEYKSYGWSSPHVSIRTGELFSISSDSIKSIWTQTLEEQSRGAGTGYKATYDYFFTRTAGGKPAISVTESIWAETQQELEQAPANPKRTDKSRFVFDGIKFVPEKAPSSQTAAPSSQ